jgi:hypothetical protein
VHFKFGLGILLDVCLARISVSKPLEEKPIHSFMVEVTGFADVGPFGCRTYSSIVKELKTIQLDPGLTIKTDGLAIY